MGFFDKFKKTESKPVQQPKKPAEQKQTGSDFDAAQKKQPAVGKVGTLEVSRILIRPLVTEKSTELSQWNKYLFEVASRANKLEIGRAIESRYGVKPVKINIINKQGKKVRYGRIQGRTSDWKKAVVTLPAGKTIEIQEAG